MLFFITTHVVYGADTLVLEAPNTGYFQYHITDQYLDYVIDSTGELTIKEVASKHIQKQQASIIPIIGTKIPEGACWLRVTIRNESSDDQKWMLLQGDPHVGAFEVYTLQEGKYVLINRGGAQIDFDERKYKSNSIVTDIDIKKGESKTYYFRYSSNIDFSYKLLVQSTTFYTAYALNEYFALGIYYGILLIMAIYNLFIYFSVRQKVYVYYALYVLATILFNTSNDLFAFQFIWPDTPSMNYLIYYYGRLALLLSVVAYAWTFLLWKDNEQEKKLLRNATLFFALQFLVEFYLFETEVYHYTLFVPLVIILIVAIKNYKQGYPPARFFLVGFGCVLVGLSLFTAMERGIIPANVFTVYAYNIGLLIEVVVLSRAIGERFRFLKQSKEESDQVIIQQLKENEQLKDKVNRELELKVAERTQELATANKGLEEANKEIQRMNELLKQENIELQYDMKELARARVMLRGVKFEEFSKIYPDDDACHKFLANLKWRRGYSCKKCSNKKYSEGKTKYSRRCTKCNYDESPTLDTIFSRVKFPIVKAFYMVFLFHSSKEKLSSTDMSRILMLRQKTCWSFIQKIKEYSTRKKQEFNIDKLENWTDLILD